MHGTKILPYEHILFNGIINRIRPVSEEVIQFQLRFPQDCKIILNPYDKMAFN